MIVKSDRAHPRYNILGRANCPEISALHGKLLDISLKGCKIMYTVPVSVNIDQEYTIAFKTSDQEGDEFTLICQPIWIKEKEGKTSMGMNILRSPDSEKLAAYVAYLTEHGELADDPTAEIVEPECTFL